MKLKETVSFSSTDYAAMIQRKEYTYFTIADNIYRKRRHLASATTTIVTSVLATPVTHGVSLVGTAFAVRNRSVEKKKLALLEDEWRQRGQDPLPSRPVKDTLIPVVVTFAIGIFAFQVDLTAAHAGDVPMPNMGGSGPDFGGFPIGTYFTCIESGFGSAASLIEDSAFRAGREHKEIKDWASAGQTSGS